jgi:hypothetical protein
VCQSLLTKFRIKPQAVLSFPCQQEPDNQLKDFFTFDWRALNVDAMDQFAPTFIALASIYIVFEMFKFMVHLCFRRNYTFEMSCVLKEISDKLQTLPFEAVCLCKDCVDGNKRRGSIAVKIDVLSPQQPENTVRNQNDHS